MTAPYVKVIDPQIDERKGVNRETGEEYVTRRQYGLLCLPDGQALRFEISLNRDDAGYKAGEYDFDWGALFQTNQYDQLQTRRYGVRLVPKAAAVRKAS